MVIVYMCSRIMLEKIGQFNQEKYTEGYYIEKENNHSSQRKTLAHRLVDTRRAFGPVTMLFWAATVDCSKDTMLG